MQAKVVQFALFAGTDCDSHFLLTPQVSFHPPLCTHAAFIPSHARAPKSAQYFPPLFPFHLTSWTEPLKLCFSQLDHSIATYIPSTKPVCTLVCDIRFGSGWGPS